MESERKWYVIHTYSGYENKVKANLERKVHSMGMEDETEIKDGQEKVTKKKIFPGYALVEMIVNDRSWYVVRNTPGVTGFVGSGTKPIPLTDDEVKRIMKSMGVVEQRPVLDIEKGEAVHINSGAFEGFAATVAEVFPDKYKLKVLVEMFGRETTVELDFDQVDKI